MNKYTTSDRSPVDSARAARLDAIEAAMGPGVVHPAAAEANWATAERGRFYRARKEAISIRIDMDVLDWLRRKGPGYQTEINRILRERMLADTPT